MTKINIRNLFYRKFPAENFFLRIIYQPQAAWHLWLPQVFLVWKYSNTLGTLIVDDNWLTQHEIAAHLSISRIHTSD